MDSGKVIVDNIDITKLSDDELVEYSVDPKTDFIFQSYKSYATFNSIRKYRNNTKY